MTTFLSITALRGMAETCASLSTIHSQHAAHNHRWHLLSGHVSGAMYPHLTGRSRVYARAAVALHHAQGSTLADKCQQAAQALKDRGVS